MRTTSEIPPLPQDFDWNMKIIWQGIENHVWVTTIIGCDFSLAKMPDSIFWKSNIIWTKYIENNRDGPLTILSLISFTPPIDPSWINLWVANVEVRENLGSPLPEWIWGWNPKPPPVSETVYRPSGLELHSKMSNLAVVLSMFSPHPL